MVYYESSISPLVTVMSSVREKGWMVGHTIQGNQTTFLPKVVDLVDKSKVASIRRKTSLGNLCQTPLLLE